VERIREVLEMIVCPACRGRLSLEQGCIRCVECRKSYPIEDGIPVLLIERATPGR
jgi:hypothetical protein